MSRCETCRKRPPTRVMGGYYLCGRCGRPDGKRAAQTALDRELSEGIADTWKFAEELERMLPGIERRQAMSDDELRAAIVAGEEPA